MYKKLKENIANERTDGEFQERIKGNRTAKCL